MMLRNFLVVYTVFYFFDPAASSAFTFELPDGENRCFYAVLSEKERSAIEFQVSNNHNIYFRFVSLFALGVATDLLNKCNNLFTRLYQVATLMSM